MGVASIRRQPAGFLRQNAPQHFFRRDRQRIDPDADSVEDGVGDCRDGRVRGHLADALGAEGAVLGGALQDRALEDRQVAGAGHQIFVEVDRAVRAVGVVRLGRLVERVAHAHPGAADDLLLDHFRVQRAADLIGALQREHRHLAGLGVDLDLRHRAGMRVAGRGAHLSRLRLGIGAVDQEHAAAGNGPAVLEMRGERRLEDRDRFRRRALDVDVALAVGLQVRGAHLELLRGDFEQHGARLLGGHDDGVADAVRAAARKGAHAVRARVGVGGVDDDVVVGDADGLGADLRHHRLQALAEIDARQRHHEVARGGRVDESLARVAAEIHAGRVVHRGDAAPARLAHAGPPDLVEDAAMDSSSIGQPASFEAACMVSTSAAPCTCSPCALVSPSR